MHQSGVNSPQMCKERFDKQTRGIQMTEVIKEYLKDYHKSVTNEVLLSCRLYTNNGDPLHIACGINNHFIQSLWDYIKSVDSFFVERIREKLEECYMALDIQETTKRQVKNIDNLPYNEGIQ